MSEPVLEAALNDVCTDVASEPDSVSALNARVGCGRPVRAKRLTCAADAATDIHYPKPFLHQGGLS